MKMRRGDIWDLLFMTLTLFILCSVLGDTPVFACISELSSEPRSIIAECESRPRKHKTTAAAGQK